jgi:hypothetical protein
MHASLYLCSIKPLDLQYLKTAHSGPSVPFQIPPRQPIQSLSGKSHDAGGPSDNACKEARSD